MVEMSQANNISENKIFCWQILILGRGDGLEVEPMSRNPESRGSIPPLGSRRSLLISIEHAELLRSRLLPRWCCAVPG